MTNPYEQAIRAGQVPNQAPPPMSAADEYAAAGVTPEQYEQFQRLNAAQSPAEYAQAANAAGLTAGAWQAAAGQVARGVQAGPVQAPSFEEQLAEYQQKNSALQHQIDSLTSQFQQQLTALQAGLAGVQASVPQKVDPVHESAAKVARAFADVVAHDAKNIMASALRSHFVNLGLEELAKLI